MGLHEDNKMDGSHRFGKLGLSKQKKLICICLATEWRDACLTVSSDTSSAPDLANGLCAR